MRATFGRASACASHNCLWRKLRASRWGPKQCFIFGCSHMLGIAMCHRRHSVSCMLYFSSSLGFSMSITNTAGGAPVPGVRPGWRGSVILWIIYRLHLRFLRLRQHHQTSAAYWSSAILVSPPSDCKQALMDHILLASPTHLNHNNRSSFFWRCN